jgi:DHA1 family solute carrier family 18 vesicular amine transporter 1/2
MFLWKEFSMEKDQTVVSSPARRAVLLVVSVAIFTDMLVYGLIVPILPGTALRLGASPAALGLLFGSYALALLLATPLIGLLTDRVGRRWPLLVGLVGLALATIFFAIATTFPLLLLARTLQGIAAATTWTAGLALLAEVFPEQERDGAMGLALTGQAAGMLLGPVLGGWLYQWGGYQLPFLCATVLALIDGALRVFLIPHAPRRVQVEPTVQPSWTGFRIGPLLWLVGAVLLGSLVPSVLEPTLPLQLAVADSATPGQIGIVFALPTLAFSVVSPLVSILTARVGRWPTILGGIILMGCVLFGLSLANGLLWNMGLMVLLGIGLGSVLAPTLPALAALVEQSGLSAYGVVYAIYNTAYSLGLFLGPLAGGSLTGFLGFSAALVIVSGALGLFVVLHLFFIVVVPLMRQSSHRASVSSDRRAVPPRTRV